MPEREMERAMENARKWLAVQMKKEIDGFAGFAANDDDGKKGWVVNFEVVENKVVPATQDLLGLYEIKLDKNFQIVTCTRKSFRKRGEVSPV